MLQSSSPACCDPRLPRRDTVLASSAARDAIGRCLPIVSESDILDVRFIRLHAVVVLMAPPDARS